MSQSYPLVVPLQLPAKKETPFMRPVSASVRRSAFVLLCLVVVLAAGCNLTSSVPVQEPLPVTPGPSVTASLTTVAGLPTRTPQGTFVRPTLAGIVVQPPVVAPPVVRPPGVIAPGVIPTGVIIIAPPILTPVPVNIAVLSPVPSSIVAGGSVQVLGSATHPNFLQYQVEFGPDPNPGNLWYLVTSPVTQPVSNGLLGIWNTLGLSDATYQLRLRVFLRDGTTQQTVVGGIRVQNTAATPVPTQTSTIPRPIAAFGTDVTTGQSPLTVRFTNASFGQITGYNWNFGNGSSSTEANPVHTYTTPALYNITLTVIGPGGTSSVSSQVNVQSPSAPAAAFTASIQAGTAPLTVQFTDRSTGGITGYLWNFSDGTTSTERNPSHTFITPGTYTVFLTVTGAGGTGIASTPITVQAPAVTALPPTAVPPTSISEATRVDGGGVIIPTTIPPTVDAVGTQAALDATSVAVVSTSAAAEAAAQAAATANAGQTQTANAPTITPIPPTETPLPPPSETPAPSPTVQVITVSDTQPVQPNFGDPNYNASLRTAYDSAAAAGTPPVLSSVVFGGDTVFRGTGVLSVFGAPGFNLNNDASVQTAVNFYGSDPDGDGQNSFNRGTGGLDSAWLAAQYTDPASANAGFCTPGETPIACAVRTTGAAVLIISVGGNDVQNGTSPDAFAASIAQIIDTTRAAGAIPLFVTVPPRPDQADTIRALNDALITTANNAAAPVVNLTPALAALPNGGLNPDNSTLSVSPSGAGDLSTAGQYGVNAINQEILRALAGLRAGVFPETFAP